MIELNLGSEEVVITECDDVVLNDGKFLREEGILVLTNLRLVWAIKGFFGKIKNMLSYPLSDIKVYDNKAQVVLKERPYIDVDIYLQNAQLSFRFGSKGRAKELVNNLNKAVTKTQNNAVAVRSIPGTAFVAETLKGTVETFKNSLGIKKKEPVQFVVSCPSCGGSVSGLKGKVVECPYCRGPVKMEDKK